MLAALLMLSFVQEVDRCFASFLHFMPIFLSRSPDLRKTEQWQLILLRKPGSPGSQTKNKQAKLSRKWGPLSIWYVCVQVHKYLLNRTAEGIQSWAACLHMFLLALWLSCLFATLFFHNCNTPSWIKMVTCYFLCRNNPKYQENIFKALLRTEVMKAKMWVFFIPGETCCALFLARDWYMTTFNHCNFGQTLLSPKAADTECPLLFIVYYIQEWFINIKSRAGKNGKVMFH